MINYDGLDAKGRVEKFDTTHGLSCVLYKGWLLFADGATRERNSFGSLCEPPENPYECAKLILKYHETRLGLAVEEFNQLKRALVMQTKAVLNEKYPPPPNNQVEAVEQLKELQKKVKERQAAFEEARKQVETSTPEAMRQRELDAQENRQRNSEFLNSIERIEV